MLHHPSGSLPSRMVCYSASGTGAQVSLDLRYQSHGAVDFLGYVDDVRDERRRTEPGYPVLSFSELLDLEDVGVFVAVHDPDGRRRVFEKLGEHGITILGARGEPHLAHPGAVLGEGSVVVCTARLAHSTVLGRGVLALGDLIAHDVEVGDFTTIAVGASVLGHVQIGDGAFIGAGAIVTNGTLRRPRLIGDGAVVGAGAVVSRNVAPGETVVGPRALPLGRWKAMLAADRAQA